MEGGGVDEMLKSASSHHAIVPLSGMHMSQSGRAACGYEASCQGQLETKQLSGIFKRYIMNEADCTACIGSFLTLDLTKCMKHLAHEQKVGKQNTFKACACSNALETKPQARRDVVPTMRLPFASSTYS
eukprot:1086287-Pelagomonas_calceolata.AAC.1